MYRAIGVGLAVTLCATVAAAQTTLSVTAMVVCEDQDLSEGVSEITVGTGCVVPYTIVGELGGADSKGLALFGFDLEPVGGGTLDRAQAPTGLPMRNFAYPDGINNPVDGDPDIRGFGGTPSGGKLLQVGGGQNTIKNTTQYAPFPIADSIVENLGEDGPVVLATGTLTVPGAAGEVTLTISELFANVVATSADPGAAYWETVAAGQGDITNLVIHVVAGGLCPCSCATIGSTNPPTGAIDAGIPHDINDNGTAYGWQSIEITFVEEAPALGGGDFDVKEKPAGGSEQVGPGIADATSVGHTVWTKITYCEQSVCFGFVPGDAGQDRVATAADIGALIDCLNETSGPCNLWECDIDRLGSCTGADIGSLVDLLNAAGMFSLPHPVGLDPAYCP